MIIRILDKLNIFKNKELITCKTDRDKDIKSVDSKYICPCCGYDMSKNIKNIDSEFITSLTRLP